MRLLAGAAGLAAVALSLLLAVPAQAVTAGLPTFTTAPGTIHVVNQFIFGLPSQSYTISYAGTIAEAQGAPQLLGQDIQFTYTVNPPDFTSPYSFSIGGVDILSGPGLSSDSVFVSLPLESFELDPATNFTTFGYGGIFSDFGPRTQPFPELELLFQLSSLPLKPGYFYCEIDTDVCEFSNVAGLTEINGNPVLLFDTFNYPEGTVANGIISFATMGEKAISPVPLPPAIWLLTVAVTGLGVLRRGRKVR
jgi:hypothetical protein